MGSSTYSIHWKENQAVPRPLAAGGEAPPPHNTCRLAIAVGLKPTKTTVIRTLSVYVTYEKPQTPASPPVLTL